MLRKLAPYFSNPMPLLFALGFASGLPYALTAGTLSIWLTEEGISRGSIGLFGGIGIAYTFKFAWSPLVDSVRIPILSRFGRRRSWLLATQAGLIASIIALACTSPASTTWLTALFALLVAIFSATQDIVIDAYRVEVLEPERQAAGAAMGVLGYRIGMIVSGAGALYLATYFGWRVTYLCMAAAMGVGVLATLFSKEPLMNNALPIDKRDVATWFRESVIAPLRDFMKRPEWKLILAFVFFYKLPDAYMGIMANPYYLAVGFAKTQIADIAKLYGVIASIAGGFWGAWMVRKWGLLPTLWIGGIACALTNLLFIPLQYTGANTLALAGVITLDNLSGGISVTAFVAYMSGLCNRSFTATQYALLSSIMAFARTASSMPSGYSAEILGWTGFFMLSTVLLLPGLWILRKLPKPA